MAAFRFLGLAAIGGLALAPLPALAGKPPAGFAATPPAPPPAHAADGAIFNVSAGYSALVTGAQARGVGDTLTIILSEITTSSKTSATKTQRSGNGSIITPTVGPFVINPGALTASSSGSFTGSGNTALSSVFTGTIAVTISEVRANGTALVRGEKRMLLSQGQEWIQFSGIVRLADVDQDNNVASGKVADARIEYAGNGAITRSAREGWLSHFFNIISPF
jgi:flagellar L-ring protein precursor FlgH